jgi:hypothetical protein
MDYKRATFEFQMKDVHPTDQMDLQQEDRGNGILHVGACFHYCVQTTSVPEQCSNITQVGEDIILCKGQ